MSDKLGRLKFLLLLLILLVALARQWQMQSEIDHLRKAQLKFEQDMVTFMNETNGSIESHTAAIRSQTRSLKIVAGIRDDPKP